MKKITLAMLIGLFTILFSTNLFAYTPPSAPTDGSFLLDQANLLPAQDAEQIRARLHQINASTRNEIAVLALATLDGQSIDDVAYATFNSWGVGKKGLDNGVLLVWSKGDRKIRIETGKGVGGELTDLQTHDIIQKMKPDMRAEKYGSAILVGINEIESTLQSRAATKGGSTTNSSPSCSESGGNVIGSIVVVVIFLIILLWFISRRGGGGGYYGGGSSSGGSWSSGGGSSGDSFGGGDSGGGGSSDSY